MRSRFIRRIPTAESQIAISAASLAFGAVLRHYTFKKYLSKKPSADDAANGGDAQQPPRDGLSRLTVHCADPAKARARTARGRRPTQRCFAGFGAGFDCSTSSSCFALSFVGSSSSDFA